MSQQEYVSQELTHFVGRTDKSQEAQFKRLVKILRTGSLKSAIEQDIKRITLGTISDHIDPCPTAICFCDIPYRYLSLHKAKYSEFGLSFLKSFLAAKGVSPVFYVAKNTVTEYWRVMSDPRGEVCFDTNTPRSELFAALREEIGRLFQLLQGKYADEREIEVAGFDIRLWRLFHHLATDVFAFVKIFDDNLDEGNVNNYYMEREWRATNRIDFSLSDVHRIILPDNYVKRFNKSFPENTGIINDKSAAPSG